MLKNPAKATRFYSDSRDRIFNGWCILKKGWLARLKGYKACPPQADKLVRAFSSHLPHKLNRSYATGGSRQQNR
jgi:hypothetical protein